MTHAEHMNRWTPGAILCSDLGQYNEVSQVFTPDCSKCVIPEMKLGEACQMHKVVQNLRKRGPYVPKPDPDTIEIDHEARSQYNTARFSTDLWAEKVLEFLEDKKKRGYTAIEIADVIGCSAQTILYRLHALVETKQLFMVLLKVHRGEYGFLARRRVAHYILSKHKEVYPQ